MKTFSAHVRKEWREHRALAASIALAFALLVVAFELVAPSSVAGNGAVPGMAALLSFATVALAFFGEAFAGEERRGTIAFLRRQPGGWWPPFAAKFAFLASASLVITSATWGSAAAAMRLLHHVAPDAIEPERVEAVVELIVLVPLWSIVVSIWFPRSTVALPAAAFVLGLFFAPIFVTSTLARSFGTARVEWSDWLGSALRVLAPSNDQLAWLLRILLIAAPAVAALSFAKGRAVERSPWRAAALGLAAVFLLFTPAYAWTAGRVSEFLRFDVRAASLRLEPQGCIATNGRFAYVNAWDDRGEAPRPGGTFADPGDRPIHGLRVDLRDGTASAIAPIGSRIWPGPRNLLHASVPYVVLSDVANVEHAYRVSSILERKLDVGRTKPVIDADTGEVAMGDEDLGFLTGVGPEGERQQRLANALVLPDGRRVWIEKRHVVRRDRDGATEVLPDSELEPALVSVSRGEWNGFGIHVGTYTWYDVVRERRVVLPDGCFLRWLRADECIVRDFKERGVGPWKRWIHDTRQFAPIVGLAADAASLESVDEMADDGRLFVATFARPKGERVPPRLALLDPDTGERAAVELPACARDWKAIAVFLAARTPSGVPVMVLSDRGGSRSIPARFDLAARRFDVADPQLAGPVDFVGCESEASVLVTDGRRLLRARFGRTGAEVVFPKSDG